MLHTCGWRSIRWNNISVTDAYTKRGMTKRQSSSGQEVLGRVELLASPTNQSQILNSFVLFNTLNLNISWSGRFRFRSRQLASLSPMHKTKTLHWNNLEFWQRIWTWLLSLLVYLCTLQSPVSSVGHSTMALMMKKALNWPVSQNAAQH